jgi:maspardin
MTVSILGAQSSLSDFAKFTAHFPRCTFVDQNGHTWHYRDNLRAGQVLVLLPGAMGSGDIAYRLAEQIGEDVRTLLVTYPSGVAHLELADGLIGLLDHLAAGTVSIWGSSYGAWWSQALAIRHPERVHALWLGNMPLDGQDVASQPLFDTQWLLRSSGAEVTQAWLEAVLQRQLSDLRSLQEWMLQYGLHPDEFRARLLQVVQAGLLPAVEGIENFVVFHCTDDPIIGPDKRQRMLNRYPNAKHLSFDIGGHYPHVTRAADLATLVRTWLKLI